MENRRCSTNKNHITKISRKSRRNKRLRKQRNTKKTRYIRKYKHKSRKNKKGGNPEEDAKKDANRLMYMLHENVKHTLSGGEHKYKPHNPSEINEGFKKLIGKPGTYDATVKETAFYHALENKKAQMNDEERTQMWNEAIIHQELPDGLIFNKGDPCKYGARCRRENPVHKFMYHNRETGFKPETCAPTVVANYMYDPTKR